MSSAARKGQCLATRCDRMLPRSTFRSEGGSLMRFAAVAAVAFGPSAVAVGPAAAAVGPAAVAVGPAAFAVFAVGPAAVADVSRDRGVRAGELAGVLDFPGGR